MVPREAGTPATDMVPVAMLLAAAAILINAWAAAVATTRADAEGGTGELRLSRGTALGRPLL